MPKSRRQIKEEIARIVTKRGQLRRKIERKIARLQGIGDLENSTLLKEVEAEINRAGFMERIIDRRFTRQAERTTGEGRWARLKPSTVRDRIRQGFNGTRPILVRTGALYGGAREAVQGSFKLSGIKWDVNQIDVSYAKYHQQGGGKLPRRAFFNDPTAEELLPTMNRVRELVRMKIRKLME